MRSGSINTAMMQVPFDLGEGKTLELTADHMPQLFKRLSEPEEIAASIAFLLGDESKFVTKSSWSIDGGWMEGSYSG
jgi:NAD(P)-dependent dehydrogenase (short-subunit alcohol dehydrogenase family)